MSKNYKIINHDLEVHSALKYIQQYDFLAFDTETTGLNVRADKVIGMSFSGKENTAIYVSRFTWDNTKQELVRCVSDENFIKIITELASKELLMWNASFDIRIVLNDLKIDLTESLAADVMLMKHTVNEEGNFALKKVAVEYQKYLGMDMETAANQEQIELKENVDKNGGSTTKTNYEMYKADLDVMGKYACADADLTLKLANLFLVKINEEGLQEFFFDTEVMPLYKYVTIPMESKGVKLNLELIEKTKVKIEKDIENLHKNIIDELLSTDEVHDWLCHVSSSKFPAKRAGRFGQEVAKKFDLPLPISEKTGKYSMTAKNIESLPDSNVKSFLLRESILDLEDERDIQFTLWEEFNSGYINISSKKQMGEIVFDYMNIKPLSKTDKGSPQFNDTMIQHLAEVEEFEWAKKLSDYNKLIKIKGAYIDRFLDSHDNGYYYFYYKQHGTLSGRFSSDAQQLPRPKEEGELSKLVLYYNNLIRSFFIAGKGRIFIDADYESLEPHVFSHVSGDEGLRNIFRKGHDFYSTIAIQTERLEGVSADKKAEDYLGKINKPLRQKAKAYSLGVPYGMSVYALAKTLEVSQEESQELYDGYLNGFPELKKWMEDSKKQAQYYGFVKTQTGRIRHLQKVKELHEKHGEKLLNYKYRKKLEKKHGYESVLEAYRDYKNGINNSRNFQIQGLSASIVNLAMIAIMKEFKKLNIDAWVCATIHDQIIVNAPIERVEDCKRIVEKHMTNVVDLSVDLKAPPELSENWLEGH